jgi:hypothetical protein
LIYDKQVIQNQDNMEQVSMEQVIQNQVTQNQQDQGINVQLKKKYRAATYDIHDQTYATQMKRFNIPQAFNDFTDGLMNETHINRFSLLQAIDDYNKTEESKTSQLESLFEDSAFNCRPYQACCIS